MRNRGVTLTGTCLFDVRFFQIDYLQVNGLFQRNEIYIDFVCNLSQFNHDFHLALNYVFINAYPRLKRPDTLILLFWTIMISLKVNTLIFESVLAGRETSRELPRTAAYKIMLHL